MSMRRFQEDEHYIRGGDRRRCAGRGLAARRMVSLEIVLTAENNCSPRRRSRSIWMRRTWWRTIPRQRGSRWTRTRNFDVCLDDGARVCARPTVAGDQPQRRGPGHSPEERVTVSAEAVRILRIQPSRLRRPRRVDDRRDRPTSPRHVAQLSRVDAADGLSCRLAGRRLHADLMSRSRSSSPYLAAASQPVEGRLPSCPSVST